MNAEIEVLDDLLKHTRKLALTRDPRRRIEVSKWEIFFAEKLARAERTEAARTEISVVPDNDELPAAVCFSKQSKAQED